MSKVINQTNGLKFLQDEAKFIQDKSTLSQYTNETVSIIHSGMFQGCTNLSILCLPNVHTIEDSAFQGCTNLSQVILPKGYNIGSSAFNGCTNLALVVLFNPINAQPETTGNIGLSAFHQCTNLSTLYLGLTAPPILAGTNPNSVFSGTLLQNTTASKGSIYVQDGLVATYKTSAIWKSNYLTGKIQVGSYTFLANNS